MDLGPLAPLGTPTIREIQPSQNVDLVRPQDPRFYPPLASHESGARDEYARGRRPTSGHQGQPSRTVTRFR